jgi:hypothetical protein
MVKHSIIPFNSDYIIAGCQPLVKGLFWFILVYLQLISRIDF